MPIWLRALSPLSLISTRSACQLCRRSLLVTTLVRGLEAMIDSHARQYFQGLGGHMTRRLSWILRMMRRTKKMPAASVDNHLITNRR